MLFANKKINCSEVGRSDFEQIYSTLGTTETYDNCFISSFSARWDGSGGSAKVYIEDGVWKTYFYRFKGTVCCIKW